MSWQREMRRCWPREGSYSEILNVKTHAISYPSKTGLESFATG
jgi:hypothetical protein